MRILIKQVMRLVTCLILSMQIYQVHCAEQWITSLADSGPGTLREALLSAQDGDIFNFQTDLSGTLLLESSLPDISSSITINGPLSNSVVIDGASQYQIFMIDSGISAISNLQLMHGAGSLGGVLLLQPLTSASLAHVSVNHCDGISCDCPILVGASAMLTTQNLVISNSSSGSGDDIIFATDSAMLLSSDKSAQPQIVLEGGTASLSKQGNGTVQISTHEPVDISLAITEGTLAFNGETSQPINVGSGGGLNGNFSCFYLVNDGFVKPGNSIGVITLSGDYNQTGTLQIELSPAGNADLLQVGGNAFLDGSLALLLEQGLYLKGETFTFLTTGGTVNGQFSNSSSNQIGLAYTLQYSPTTVQIEVLNNTLSLQGAEFTGNTNEVMTILEDATVFRGTDLFSVMSALNATNSPSSLAQGLDQLDPDHFLSIAWSDATTLYQLSGMASSQQFTFYDIPCSSTEQSTIKNCPSSNTYWRWFGGVDEKQAQQAKEASKDSACCPPRKANRLWVSGIGERTRQHTIESLIGFRTCAGGAFLGYDRRVAAPLSVGAYVGYTYSHLSWVDSTHHGKTNTNGYYASLYSTFCWKHLQMDAAVIGSLYHYNIARKIDFTNIHRTARSSPHGHGLLGHFGASTFFPIKKVHFFPFAKIDYISIWQDQFREHGAGSIDLIVSSTRTGFIHAEAGLFADRRFCMKWGAVVPSAGLSWVYLGPTSGTHIKGKLVSVPETINSSTSNHGFNAIAPMASLGFIVGDQWWISAAYKGEFAKDRTEQTINLNARWQF